MRKHEYWGFNTLIQFLRKYYPSQYKFRFDILLKIYRDIGFPKFLSENFMLNKVQLEGIAQNASVYVKAKIYFIGYILR